MEHANGNHFNVAINQYNEFKLNIDCIPFDSLFEFSIIYCMVFSDNVT